MSVPGLKAPLACGERVFSDLLAVGRGEDGLENQELFT